MCVYVCVRASVYVCVTFSSESISLTGRTSYVCDAPYLHFIFSFAKVKPVPFKENSILITDLFHVKRFQFQRVRLNLKDISVVTFVIEIKLFPYCIFVFLRQTFATRLKRTN